MTAALAFLLLLAVALPIAWPFLRDRPPPDRSDDLQRLLTTAIATRRRELAALHPGSPQATTDHDLAEVAR